MLFRDVTRAQAFVLWQVLQLEATGQAQACQAQTLAYLERRRGVQAGRAADAPHLAALCRLYAVDVLVGALGRPAHEAIDFACAQWLDELVGTSSQVSASLPLCCPCVPPAHGRCVGKRALYVLSQGGA